MSCQQSKINVNNSLRHVWRVSSGYLVHGVDLFSNSFSNIQLSSTAIVIQVGQRFRQFMLIMVALGSI